MIKNPPANVGDTGVSGLISGLGRAPGGGKGNPFQYCCLKHPVDRGAWRAAVHGVAESRTGLSEHSAELQLQGCTAMCLSICQLMFFWVLFTVGCYE